MKIGDIKGVLEFLNKDGMDAVKRVDRYINVNCPDEIGLKKYDYKEGCQEAENCHECWYKSLNLKENQDKLDNVI
ncbi:hypothetical protein [Clostridium baratii]|uniref:hypothetical protein n=1 Tax=Clostridium baratii TaxID=1561 RepID=UPI0030CC90A6